MICPKCGHEAKDTDRFCVKCATKLVPSADEIEAAAEAAANEISQQEAQYMQEEPAAYEPESPSTLNEAFSEIPAAPLPETVPAVSESYAAAPAPEAPESPEISEPVTLNKVEKSSGNCKPLTTWGFIWRILLFMIPIFNMIPLFVFAFASGINKNSRSFARAVLILMLIGVILVLGGIAALFVIYNGQGIIEGLRQTLLGWLS